MKYRDLFLNNPSFFDDETPEPICLAWSANHEHAVFLLDETIHPKAKFVWIKLSKTPFILCYERKRYWNEYCYDSEYQLNRRVYHEYNPPRWDFVELKLGNIPLVNNNPFKPCGNAASNTAESVFPQNR